MTFKYYFVSSERSRLYQTIQQYQYNKTICIRLGILQKPAIRKISMPQLLAIPKKISIVLSLLREQRLDSIWMTIIAQPSKQKGFNYERLSRVGAKIELFLVGGFAAEDITRGLIRCWCCCKNGVCFESGKDRIV